MEPSSDQVTLDAWNEWKNLCAVQRCTPEHQKILASAIAAAFRTVLGDDRFRRVADMPYAKRNADLANEFDCGIIEKGNAGKMPLPVVGQARQPKNYKDYVWLKARESNDPPLKVIRGMLLGRNGLINAIASHYYRRQFDGTFRKKDGRYVYDDWSLRTTERQDDFGSPFEELLCTSEDDSFEKDGATVDLCSPDSLDSDDMALFVKAFTGAFLNEEAGVLLATAAGLSLASQTVISTIGKGKSQCYQLAKKAVTKLRSLPALDEDYLELLHCPAAMEILIDVLKKQLSSEKSYLPLLKTVEEER